MANNMSHNDQLVAIQTEMLSSCIDAIDESSFNRIYLYAAMTRRLVFFDCVLTAASGDSLSLPMVVGIDRYKSISKKSFELLRSYRAKCIADGVEYPSEIFGTYDVSRDDYSADYRYDSSIFSADNPNGKTPGDRFDEWKQHVSSL